jgi:hypothetical protein
VLSTLQVWTTPLWLVLMVLPFAYLLISHPDSINGFFAYQGEDGRGATSLGSIMLAAGVCLSLIAQIAEQIDYLRFMPPRTPENSRIASSSKRGQSGRQSPLQEADHDSSAGISRSLVMTPCTPGPKVVRLLAVEDDPAMAAMLTRELRRAGYDVRRRR